MDVADAERLRQVTVEGYRIELWDQRSTPHGGVLLGAPDPAERPLRDWPRLYVFASRDGNLVGTITLRGSGGGHGGGAFQVAGIVERLGKVLSSTAAAKRALSDLGLQPGPGGFLVTS